MALRLAFAVATAVAPRILIVDEALAVGDEAFQRKCFARIEKMREARRARCCSSRIRRRRSSSCAIVALLLDGGEMLLLDEPRRVVPEYQRILLTGRRRAAAARAAAPDRHTPNDAAPRRMRQPPTPRRRRSPARGICRRRRRHFDPDLRSTSMVEYPVAAARASRPRISHGRGRTVNVLVRGDATRSLTTSSSCGRRAVYASA